MRKQCITGLVVLMAVLAVQYAASASNQPKPNDVLRQMADYLGNLPAFGCRVEATLEVSAEGEEATKQVTKMTVRVQRPNKLALVIDEGKMGMTVVSDGKQLTQYLPVLMRYAVSEVPPEYAQMTDIGIPLRTTILGSTGFLLPVPGDEYFKRLTSEATGSKYLGAEKVGGVPCHHLRFSQNQFDWDIWIEEGKRPVVQKVVLDMSKQVGGDHAKVTYTTAFSDWNVAPKFTDADFAFKPPSDAEQVEFLIEPDPPHPLIGQPASAFSTVDLDEQPFDMKSHLGKNVVLLEFWSTTCPACVMAMPELDKVADKYADRGLVFRAVNLGEDAETIKEFLRVSKLQAPVAMDPEGEIAQGFGVRGIPQIVLIGKDGRVHVLNEGYSEQMPAELSKQIESLLAGKDLASETLSKAKKGAKPGK